MYWLLQNCCFLILSNIGDDISRMGCWAHHSKYFEKWACGCGHFIETIYWIYKKMCHIVMYHYLDMKWLSGYEIFGHIAQPCDWQLFSEEEVWECLVLCLWFCLDVFVCICFFEARALVCMWLCLRSCRCAYAFLWVRAGGSMCLPVINLMVRNSIRPCCWIHPVKIHQRGRGHLHSGSSRGGRSLQSQTKGRRNTRLSGLHSEAPIWAGVVLRAERGRAGQMTKLTKNSESQSRSEWTNACHLFIMFPSFGHALILAN